MGIILACVNVLNIRPTWVLTCERKGRKPTFMSEISASWMILMSLQ